MEASKRLEEAVGLESLSELEKDGVIQRFEFTFELAWKTLKDYLEDQGFVDVVSPKKAIQTAFEQKLFNDGDTWMDMLVDRNKMSHIYDKKIRDEILKNICSKYSSLLSNLAKNLGE